jgi:hypothetical protein
MKHRKPEHKYTQTERKKIYSIKKIKLKKDNTSITKKKSKAAYNERLNAIGAEYAKYPKTVFCPAIQEYVAINRNSRRKTKNRAALDSKSTRLAFNIPQLIENAVLIYDNRRKNNTTGQKTFDSVFVLFCAVKNIGYAKITIGRYSPETTDTQAPFVQYCVSHISLHEIRNK